MSDINYKELTNALNKCGEMNTDITGMTGLMTTATLSINDADPWGNRKQDLSDIKDIIKEKDNWKQASDFRSAVSAIESGNKIS